MNGACLESIFIVNHSDLYDFLSCIFMAHMAYYGIIWHIKVKPDMQRGPMGASSSLCLCHPMPTYDNL